MQRILAVSLLFMGCHGVGQTGPRGIKGVLVTADGAPIARQRISSEEHGMLTDEDGRFEVRWKDPATFVDFNRGGLKWRRAWQRDTDAGEVRVELPPLREGELVCRTELECMADVSWTFGDGLKAETRIQCGEKVPASVFRGLPRQLPTVRCSTILGDLDLDVREDRGRVLIKSRPQPLPVEFEGADEATCQPAILHGDVVEGVGVVGLRPTQSTYAWAVCDGRAGTPVPAAPMERIGSTSEATIELPASLDGVDLVLDPPLDKPRTLTLVHQRESGSIAWEIRVDPVDGGTYKLPPLPRGDYRLGWGSKDVFSQVNPPDPEIPGTVVIVARSGPWGQRGGYVGALRLEEDTPKGTLKVDGHPPEAYLGDR
ncbi:MAG: hypothetical protein EA397_11850 [Deltaproteobacteria bacterium]|nr:MAG: hypothetical protein EA397_11850 [Deltaproteobacteria bacterium]